MKKIGLQLFQTILLGLSYFIPRNKKLICYGDNNLNSSIYLARHASKQQDGYRNVYLTPYQSVIEMLSSEGVEAVKHKSIYGIFLAFRAGTYVISSSKGQVNSKLSRHAKIINLWHGISVKNIGALEFKSEEHRQEKLKKYAPFVLVPSTSKLTQKCFMAAFGKSEAQTPCLGEPRNDLLVRHRDSPTRKHFEKILSFDTSKFIKVICYMPTWRDYGSWDTGIDWTDLNKLMKTRGYLLIIKPHPKDPNFNELKEFSNIKIVKREAAWQDAYEILVGIDLLITDYSSVAFEFLLTHRPVILYTPDLERFQSSRNFWVDFLDMVPCEPLSSFKEMKASIIELLDNPEPREKYLQALNLLHEVQDGTSSEKIYDAIKEINKAG